MFRFDVIAFLCAYVMYYLLLSASSVSIVIPKLCVGFPRSVSFANCLHGTNELSRIDECLCVCVCVCVRVCVHQSNLSFDRIG